MNSPMSERFRMTLQYSVFRQGPYLRAKNSIPKLFIRARRPLSLHLTAAEENEVPPVMTLKSIVMLQ